MLELFCFMHVSAMPMPQYYQYTFQFPRNSCRLHHGWGS